MQHPLQLCSVYDFFLLQLGVISTAGWRLLTTSVPLADRPVEMLIFPVAALTNTARSDVRGSDVWGLDVHTHTATLSLIGHVMRDI